MSNSWLRSLRQQGIEDFRHPPSKNKLPVIIVPGIYENWRFMLPLISALYADGHPVHVIKKLGYNSGDISKAAKLVSEYILENGLSEVSVVAHSKGGLIAKFCMARYDPENRIYHLISINSPFSGSDFAKYMLVPGLKIFRPNHPVIFSLQKELIVNSKITSIFAEFDPHIPNGSRLEGAKNITLPAVGHFRILGSRQLHEAVLKALTT